MIAIILVMATRYFFLANNNNRINIARQQVGSVVSAINSWKHQNPQYSPSLDISTLYNDGFLARSSNLIVSGQQGDASAHLYNPWGSEIVLRATTTSATVTLSLPQRSDCTSLRNSFPDGVCNNNQFTLTIT